MEAIPKVLPRRHPVTGERIVSDPARTTRKPERSRAYRSFVGAQPCCHCMAAPPSDPHHVSRGEQSGTGTKPSDYRTAPLCRPCHDEYHSVGELSFWGRDTQAELELVMARQLVAYFGLTVDVTLPSQEDA